MVNWQLILMKVTLICLLMMRMGRSLMLLLLSQLDDDQESKSGLAALMRSSYLVKGMRWVSFLLLLYPGYFGGFVVWVCWGCLYEFNGWDRVLFMTGLALLMWYLLHSTVANTVPYNNCKALHGELAIDQIAEGFDLDYDILPFDDENAKEPRVVTVVTTR